MKRIFVVILCLCMLCTSFAAVNAESSIRILTGDVNMDNTVNTGDAVFILKHCADVLTITDKIALSSADYNRDNIINTADASLVLKAVAEGADSIYCDIPCPDGYYIINNADDLMNVSEHLNEICYLNSDIDLSDLQWKPIVGTFTGTFFGNRHIIRNMTCDKSQEFGLFHENYGTIDNLLLLDCNITNSHGDTGIISYKNNGTITHCGTTGNISIDTIAGWDGLPGTGSGFLDDREGYYQYNGGICSKNYTNGLINECWSGVNITAGDRTFNYYCGDFCGWSDGSIKNCFAFGTVSAPRSGGFVGQTDYNCRMEMCYSICKISTVDTWTKHSWGECPIHIEQVDLTGFVFLRGMYYVNDKLKTDGWDEYLSYSGSWGGGLYESEWNPQFFKAMGFSESIWDYSSKYQTLKNNPLPDGVVAKPQITPFDPYR